jgi:hypothetical protein
LKFQTTPWQSARNATPRHPIATARSRLLQSPANETSNAPAALPESPHLNQWKENHTDE